MTMSKPTLGVFGLTGCAGCQLAILNCENELLDLIELVDVRDFVMASSEQDAECKLDLALVEGAVVTARDEQVLRRIRERADRLVGLGTCAVWGGVAGMRPHADRRELLLAVYGQMGRAYDASCARPLKDFVQVDASITGCPIEKSEFLAAIANLLRGLSPQVSAYPVCAECRMRENRCLLINDGLACFGSLTQAGCGARCPSLGVACIGCRGPAPDANYPSALALFVSKGYARDELLTRLGTFAPAPALAEEAV